MKRCRQIISDFIGIVCPVAKRKKFTNENIIVDDVEQMPLHTISRPIIVNINEQRGQQMKTKLTPPPINIFALNGDCMRKIFEYCSVADLFNMAMGSDELEMAVVANGVRGRLIDFEELTQCCHILDVFKVFGQHMTKIKIGEKDIQYKDMKITKFDEILRLIAKYCSVDTLKCLNFQYYYGTRIKKRYLYAALPFFRSVESFTMNETDYDVECPHYFFNNPKFNHSVNDFVERVLGNALYIRSIEFYQLKINGRFFHLQHVQNLKTLSMVGCNVRVPAGFISFLKDKPKLKSFTWDNSSLFGFDSFDSNSSNVVYELVVNNISHLEALVYDPNQGFINDQGKYDMDLLFIPPKYELLVNFDKLKILSFPQMTLEGFKILAEKNTIERLDCFHKNMYFMDLNTLINYYDIFPFYVDDDSIDLDFLENNNIKYIRLFTSASMKRFNVELLSKLSHLTECSLIFLRIDNNAKDVIAAAVENASNLLTLHILSLNEVISIALYSKLLEIRLRHSTNTLTIYIKIKSIGKFLSRLGHNYRPDVITIRAAT